MDQASDGIFLADAEGIYIDVNRRGCEMLGRTREDIVGRHVREFVAPDDIERRPLAYAALQPGEPLLSERWLVRGDGRELRAEISVSRLDDGNYLAILRDVTTRRQSEETAQRAEASFRAVLDVLPDTVIVHREGRVVYANATAGRAYGAVSPDALVGTAVFELVHPEYRAVVQERVRAMAATGAPAEPQRERLVRRDGTAFDAEVVALPLRFNGEAAFLAVARDLTERERLQAQVIQGERLASVGLLAAGVAHEVNNPLAYTLLNLERIAIDLAAPSFDIAAMREATRDAIDGARRVQRIVRDLQTFARGASDDTAAVDVDAVIDAALQLSLNEFRFRARMVRERAARSRVRANADRLTQVFINLLMNAAQALPEGRVDDNEVRITTTARDGEVRVDVRDTGTGIAREHLSRLFDPFFTTKPPGMGTGLGLAICHSTIHSFGGRIEVQSEPGRGSCFTVILPAYDAIVTVQGVADERPSRPVVERRRILVVEDERNMRSVLESLLREDYDVTAVSTGSEALRLLRDGDGWDVVLCDLLMPQMSGMDLYEWMEAERPALTRRTVFMTGGAFTERARALLERCPGRWIEKPFDFDALLEQLDRVHRAARKA